MGESLCMFSFDCSGHSRHLQGIYIPRDTKTVDRGIGRGWHGLPAIGQPGYSGRSTMEAAIRSTHYDGKLHAHAKDSFLRLV